MSREEQNNVTIWWRRFENGRRYQATLRMPTLLPRYVDFYEGRQYPPVTLKTKDVPRPVLNVTKWICRLKKANILSTKVRCVYRAPLEAEGGGDESSVAAFNDFSAYIAKEMEEERIDDEVVRCGIIKGTGIWHYFWDADARGVDGRCSGGLRCESVDPLCCFVEDPTEPDEQKQAWILIAARMPVSTVRARADPGVDLRAIVPDERSLYEGGSASDQKEQEDSELCTLLVGYFRKNGEVMVETATRTCIINRAHPITPDVDGARERLRRQKKEDDSIEHTLDSPLSASPCREDAANAPMPEIAGIRSDRSEERVDRTGGGAPTYLYPLVIWSYEPRFGSIYGCGEVEALLPNQRTVNEILSSMAFSVKQMGYPKTVVLPGALGGQTITNEPGQVLVDWTKTGGGYQYLQGTSSNPGAGELVDLIMTLTRTISGATEVMTGEPGYANMSGAAIAQIQSQARVPIEDIRRDYWRAVERCGCIKAQFFRTHYAQKSYTRRKRSKAPGIASDGDEWERAVFRSDDYRTIPIACVCEATTGTGSSAAGDIHLLETAYAKGEIDFRTLIESYPESAIGNRSEILQAIAAKEAGEIAVLCAQNEQLKTQNAELLAEAESLRATIAEQSRTMDHVEQLIRANQRLKQELADIYAEFTYKIAAANAQTTAANQSLRQTTEDAKAFAQYITGG